MYAIVVEGEIIQFCNEPWYVKQIKGNDGKPLWVKAKGEEDAEAVSANSVKYNLVNKEVAIEGAETAVIIEKDGPGYLLENRKNLKKTDEELANAVNSLEDALCETDTTMLERLGEIENVLCDIDTLIGGMN